MKKILGILLIILILPMAGCKQEKKQPPQIDHALQQMVIEWTQLMSRNEIDYLSRFQDIRKIQLVNSGSLDDGYHAGESNKEYKTISIDVDNFKEGYWSTRNTVYHELGHYVFGLKHVDKGLNIMNTSTTSEVVCKQNWRKLENKYVKACKANE